MKISDYIIKFFEEKNVKNCYYLAGGMVMFLNDSLYKSNLNLISVLHEEDSTICSNSDNTYANKLNSIVCITAGPGGLNTLNGVVASYFDSVPLFILSGQVKTIDLKNNHFNVRKFGVQENDIISMVKNITKYAITIENKNEIKYHLEKAYYLATTGRTGPVWVDIPLDIQNEEIDENNLNSFYIEESTLFKEQFNYNFNQDINKLIELLNESKKPIILAGNGIRLSGGLEKFKEVLAYTGIPCLLSWRSKDSLEYQFNFGMPGVISSRYANNILQECDLLISIGTLLDNVTVAYDYKNFAPKAKKVIVDIDRAEIDKLDFEKELVFNCDAKMFIKKLLEETRKKIINTSISNQELTDIINRYENWKGWCFDQKEKYPILPHESKLVDPYTFVEQLSKYAKEDDVIVTSSSGSASEIMCQAFKIKEGQRFLSSNGLGSMGYAVSASFGAAIASGKRVICVEGDGSFAMNFKSLHLIKKYNLPIKIFIWNNQGYNSIKTTQNKFFGEYINCDEESGLSFPSIQKIAQVYNLWYFKIKNNDHLIKNLSSILDNDLSMIIECKIDPSIQTQPRVQSYIDENGKMQSGKLEKMWPFLEDTNKV